MKCYIKPELIVILQCDNYGLLAASGNLKTDATFGSNENWKVDPVNADDDGGDIPENRGKGNNLWADE